MKCFVTLAGLAMVLGVVAAPQGQRRAAVELEVSAGINFPTGGFPHPTGTGGFPHPTGGLPPPSKGSDHHGKKPPHPTGTAPSRPTGTGTLGKRNGLAKGKGPEPPKGIFPPGPKPHPTGTPFPNGTAPHEHHQQ